MNDHGTKSKFSIGLKYALSGIYVFFRDGRNAKIHLTAAVMVTVAGIYIGLTREEWLWISISIALVFIAEMINTSLEKICDLVKPEKDETIKKIKDIAAGAVLIAAIFSLVVAGMIFLPRTGWF